MTTAVIRRKVIAYLQTADAKKVCAIYTLLEDEIGANDFDKDFIKELDRRSKSFLDGTAKMYTLEEARKVARDRIKAKRKAK